VCHSGGMVGLMAEMLVPLMALSEH